MDARCSCSAGVCSPRLDWPSTWEPCLPAVLVSSSSQKFAAKMAALQELRGEWAASRQESSPAIAVLCPYDTASNTASRF